MSIHAISRSIAKYLCEFNQIPEKEPIVAYGLELMLSETSKLIMLLMAAYLMGIVWPVILVVIPAVMLRVVTGGRHCTSSLRCAVLTLITYLMLGTAASLLAREVGSTTWLLIYTFVSSVLFIMALEKYGPGYSVNNPSPTTEVINRFKKIAYLMITLWLVIIVSMAFITDKEMFSMILASTTTGVLWQSFSLTKTGQVIVEKADRLMIALKIR